METPPEAVETTRASLDTTRLSGAGVGLLEDVALAANGAATPTDALGPALGMICRATGWPVGHVWLRAADGLLDSSGIWHSESIVQCRGLEAFRVGTESRRFAAGIGLPGRVLANGRPAWIDDGRAADNFPRQSLMHEAGLAGGCAFPVLVKGNVVAVLEFYTAQVTRPSPDLVGVMAHVGVQLGRVFERRDAAEALAANEQRMREILDSAANAFIGMDAAGNITAWNAAAEAIFGWVREEALGRSVADTIIPLQHRDAHRRGMERFLANGTPRVLGQRLELPALHRSGREFPIEITLWSLRESNGWSFHAFAHDITERKEADRHLEQRVLYDPLTGLPNRTLLLDRLEQLLAGRDEVPRLAVLFIDLDHFKRINDSFGHNAGDQVLVAVAERLRSVMRPVDTVGRLAGDEFVVICPDADSYRDCAVIAQRLLDQLKTPIQLRDDSVFLSASVGIALAETGNDAETLLSSADIAMYQAKSGGGAHYELYDSRLKMEVANRLRIEGDMRKAMEDDQFRLFFQPIVSAADGSVVSMEALLRWQHPERGLLLPAEFIPIAEETGLIVPIGTWVLEEACRQAQVWQSLCNTDSPLCVSVNLSGRQLAQSDMVTTVERVLASVTIDPARVQFGLEVTETVVMRDPVAAAERLQALRKLGVRLSIDDFGTGYSSLAYLKQFPVDTVKIDRAFVAAIADSKVDQAIVSAVTDLAHTLGLAVVAEGVETVGQADMLRKIGVDHLQGFLYARPQPPAVAMTLLERPLLPVVTA